MASRTPVNILFMMSDQHNARASGCYGNRELKTPNIDRLAAEGVRFERAFCQTGQCSPSRFSIMTGLYARTHGLYANSIQESADVPTVAEMFKSANYVTATIGKHHLSMDQISDKHGFDVVIDERDFRKFVRSENAPMYDRDGQWLPEFIHPGRSRVGRSDADNDHHPSGYFTAETLKFLRQNRDKPFCVWYSFPDPHTPITPSEPWATMYDPAKLSLPPNNAYAFDYATPGLKQTQTKSGEFNEEYHRKCLAYYYGSITQMDYNIGRVLDELDLLGLSENTLVVYTSDHGEMMGEHGAWTKGLLGYDATLRVPLIFRLPGVFPAGAKREELVCLIDLLPTLLETAGLDIPAGLQGRSLAPVISGRQQQWRDVIFSEIGDPRNRVTLTVRSRDMKYVRYDRTMNGQTETEYEQFFDLRHDSWEMRNEIGLPLYNREIAALKEKLADWEAITPAAPLPSPQNKLEG